MNLPPANASPPPAPETAAADTLAMLVQTTAILTDSAKKMRELELALQRCMSGPTAAPKVAAEETLPLMPTMRDQVERLEAGVANLNDAAEGLRSLLTRWHEDAGESQSENSAAQ